MDISKIKLGNISYFIKDPNVPSWAKATSKPSYNYSEITGTPSSLPASDVYNWAKASSKPSYSLDEVSDGTTRKLSNYQTVVAKQGSATKPVYVSANGTFAECNSYPTSLPASDVYSWAKASTKPSYSYSEISGTPTIPTTLPASDVYSWAKASSKPSYTASEVGAVGTSTSGLKLEVVSSLPSSPDTNTIYIVQ